MDESDNAETSNLTLDNELSDDDVLMADVIEAAIEERFAAANRDDSNDGASSESVGKHMFTGSTPALSPSDSSPKPVGSKHNFDLFGSARSRDSTNDENSPLVSLPAPVELPTSTRLGITVKALHVAAEWKWRQGGDDTCGICQMAFEACCVNCKMPGDDCPLVVGMCRHPFHSHCITKWTISQTTARPLCPMCRQEWRVSPAKTVS